MITRTYIGGENKMKIRVLGMPIQEHSREQIDRLVWEGSNMLWNKLLDKGIAQHRDEARILVWKAIQNRPDIREMIADEASKLLEEKKVGFYYDPTQYKRGNYINKGYYKDAEKSSKQ